jgi:DNA-binding transcriptional MerR regulator
MTMLDASAIELPTIPGKRYFTIGEVSELCAVKPHVLRYWEQEFSQLRPVKRRGNRRYYQRDEVELIRSIRKLLYLKGYTISGARNELQKANNRLEDESKTISILHENYSRIIDELESISSLLRG